MEFLCYLIVVIVRDMKKYIIYLSIFISLYYICMGVPLGNWFICGLTGNNKSTRKTLN